MTVFLNHMGLPFPQPTSVITSPSVHCPPTRRTFHPTLTPHHPLWNTRALSALLPASLQPLFRTDSFPVRACSFPPVALLPDLEIMGHDQSFPLSRFFVSSSEVSGRRVWARMISKASTGQGRHLSGLCALIKVLFLFWLAS